MAKLRTEVAEKYLLVGNVGDTVEVAGVGRVTLANMSVRMADHLHAQGVRFLKLKAQEPDPPSKKPTRKRKKTDHS